MLKRKWIYAGFWKRLCAAAWDITIFFGILYPLGYGLAAILDEKSLYIATGILVLVVYLFYFVWMESSPWQATVGKKLFKLKVTDTEGRRISFWRSLGRHLAMYFSNLFGGIGYFMCLWTDNQQCLHDTWTGCLVVEEIEEVEENVEIMNIDIEETKEHIGWH